MSEKHNFSHVTAVFPVAYIQKYNTFYTGELDFQKTFTWGNPVEYVVLKRGGVQIHLTEKADQYKPSPKHCPLYIFVYDVEGPCRAWRENNVNIRNTPDRRNYEMTDFDIIVPDGFIIIFGKGGRE